MGVRRGCYGGRWGDGMVIAEDKVRLRTGGCRKGDIREECAIN